MVCTPGTSVRGNGEEKRAFSKSAYAETPEGITQPVGTHLLPVSEGTPVVGSETICAKPSQGRRTTLNQKLIGHTRHAVDSFSCDITAQTMSEA